MQLSAKKIAAIEQLASGESITEAARDIGISRRTLHSWVKQPEFAKALEAAKAEILHVAYSRLRRVATLAVDALVRVASGEERHPYPSASASAARSILELAIRSHESEELEARIAKLEGNPDEEKEPEWDYEPIQSTEETSEE